MRKLIVIVCGMLVASGTAPLTISAQVWKVGVSSDYFLEPDCEHVECASNGDCCTYFSDNGDPYLF